MGGDGLGVPRLDRGAERVAAVGLDDDGRLQVPARMGPGLDGCDRAGHGGVDGDAEALAVADLLADGHAVSDFDERLAGRADVLRHRDGDDARVQRDDGRLTRKLLIALWMDAAEKGSFQGCTTSVHEVLGSGGRSKARRKGSILRQPVRFFDSLTAYFNIPHRAGKIYGYFLTLLIFLRIFADSIRKYLYKNTEKKRMGERGKSKMESGKFCKAVSRVLSGSGTEMKES